MEGFGGGGEMMCVASETPRWNRDLARLERGERSLADFAQQHRGIIWRHARRWAGRCPERLDIDDASQELLLAIWQAVKDWDPARGVPLHCYVRKQMHFSLLGNTDRHLKGRAVEATYWANHGRCNQRRADESVPTADDRATARQRLALVVGSLDAADAELVMSVMECESLEDVLRRVYPNRTREAAKKKARAVFREVREMLAETDGDPAPRGRTDSGYRTLQLVMSPGGG
jgi:DNA-directed RNA polymerase specialized sigma24 family protein